jgi:hypothetical protein
VIRNGAQVVWESLVREGIDVIFGIPGGAVIPLYQFLCDYPICLIFMRHEQAAIHAADGYARVSGRVGVCLVTSGPGATNLVMGSATARGFIPGCGTYRAGAPRNTLRAACCYGVGCDVHLLVSLRRLDSSHSALVSPQRRKRAARNRHVLAFTCALPQAGEGYQPW